VTRLAGPPAPPAPPAPDRIAGDEPSTFGVALVAPAAVQIVDLEAPLSDLQLPLSDLEEPYRSLMVVARLEGEPLGVATFSVDGGGWVSRERLGDGLRHQLEAELEEAFDQRGLVLPEPLPRAGVPRVKEARRASARWRPVSVVVATCCNPEALERCLHSIFLSDYRDFEVIVVENRPGSSATRRMLAKRFPHATNLRYVEEPRVGVSRARNAGLALARGEIVAFTDDDVVVDPGWIRQSTEALERADDVACVTGLILPLGLEDDSQLLLEQFAGFGKGFHRHTYRLPEAREDNPLFPYTAGTMGSGASTVMRADVARQLAGFDTTLGPGTPTTGGEDLDLFIRVLRAGHAVAYEPSAIVWHRHPEGMPSLRRQVYRYGIGLGAMLEKQLIAGPERMELLRAVPAGLRYTRDPESRKNAGKPADYPSRLTWLERLGMLIGPAVYVLSALMALAQRLAGDRSTGQPTRTVTRVLLSSGRTVEVVRFDELEFAPPTPRRRLRLSRALPRSSQYAVLAAMAACVAAPLSVALGLPTVLRLPAVLAFLCLLPGVALLTAARGRMEAGLVVGVSLGVTAVAAQSMLWLGAWWPRTVLYALAAACLVPLASSFELSMRQCGGGRRRDAALMRIRDAIAGIPRTAWRHSMVLVLALGAWAASPLGADLNGMGGVGLLSGLPPTYFFAFALLLIGFAIAVANDDLSPKLLGLYVVALVLVLHGTTPLLYDEPRYAWTYKHLGVIELIGATGGVDRQIDVYNNWPAFFAANAWFSKVVGLGPIDYAGFAQLFFSLVNVAAARFALRGLTANERLLWTGTFFFVLGNWVAQDYLAPQAFAFALSLVVLGLCLRCGPAVTRPRSGPGRWLAGRLEGLTSPVVPRRWSNLAHPQAPLGPRGALLAGGLCFLAVVTSHQLSPVLLILGVGALALFARRVPLWVPLAMAMVEVWWVALSWPFVGSHFNLIQLGAAGAGAPGRDLGAALPGATLTLYAPAVVMGLIIMLALIGMLRRLRAGERDLAPLCLIGAPVLGAGLQSYGGEGAYRAFLFGLPWLAFFAAAACTRAPSPARDARLSFPRVLVAASAVGVSLLFAYFGQELANRIRPDDVRAAAWYEEHAPPGSIRLNLAPVSPDRLTARYPKVSLGDPVSLLERRAFTGHRLGAGDLPRLERLVAAQRPSRTFLVLTRGQEDYGRLNGLLPKGSVASLTRALTGAAGYRLVYRRPTAWIYEYAPRLAL
jgi:GT2 family glycosyltransferase